MTPPPNTPPTDKAFQDNIVVLQVFGGALRNAWRGLAVLLNAYTQNLAVLKIFSAATGGFYVLSICVMASAGSIALAVVIDWGDTWVQPSKFMRAYGNLLLLLLTSCSLAAFIYFFTEISWKMGALEVSKITDLKREGSRS